ncbi:MAG: Acetate permease ActP (cation/acetate symporter) [uncultured Phycisphaerae bacterium]|uniref:Acetate permease ActP (Cation/acetate symporter) n=1 Tax=uncultured Phycisphaerae bacterium TaxID=904963 RepID=A0A6J4N242_9BACT|nr:MAG: Acetate permease ActP (cation/acetate symporter) [uncultured Phycisphaerae bacterium]
MQGFSWTAFSVFAVFVAFVLGISFYLGSRAKSAKGYFAAHGQVGWFVNGIAFAGDYLSAASFLGICGMIAFYGYDGFLYSIGFLAGWVVALFVIAEPIKRLGKYTFADALDSQFNSRGIKLAAAVSTLLVSLFYLIPQMVGAGSLIKPLLGLEHWHGVLIVGVVVITIVATAGMVSTTWVQFIKGSLLVVFCFVLTVMILGRGLTAYPEAAGATSMSVPAARGAAATVDGRALERAYPIGTITRLPNGQASTGPLGPLEYIETIQNSEMVKWKAAPAGGADGTGGTAGAATAYAPVSTNDQGGQLTGGDFLVPGANPLFAGVRSDSLVKKLDFLSLMLALFAGTASLPHILIRYYTVKDAAAARKSTVVGIASIGFFYVLTLYLGLGAMTSLPMMPATESNMAAPLLARQFGELLFAIISAIAFTTVLGTVSGLILAASGAVAHDLMTNYFRMTMDDRSQVRAAKMAAVVIGVIAMVLGIVFEKFNATFLVGWAFNVAASANLPALVMLLFWRGTTKQGITVAIVVGLVSSLAWLALTGPAYQFVYGLDPTRAPMPFSQPALVTVPLGFAVLIVVSLMTRRGGSVPVEAVPVAPAGAQAR